MPDTGNPEFPTVREMELIEQVNRNARNRLRDPEYPREAFKSPVIPLMTDRIEIRTVIRLMKYWNDMHFYDQTIANPYYYPTREEGNDLNPETVEMLNPLYYQKIIDPMIGSASFMTVPSYGMIKRYSTMKTIPISAVTTSRGNSPRAGREANFIPRNYDANAVTSNTVGAGVRILAYYQLRDPINSLEFVKNRYASEMRTWVFVIDEQGNFGWMDKEDVIVTDLEPLEHRGRIYLPGYRKAFINTAFAEVVGGKVQASSSVPNHRRIFTLGSSVWVKEINGKVYCAVPSEEGNELVELEIDPSIVHIGYKKLTTRSITSDLQKLLELPYAWAGNELYDSKTRSYYYGGADCSLLLSRVLRAYGYLLPDNNNSQARMFKTIYKSKLVWDGERSVKLIISRAELIKLYREGKLVPGKTFFVTKNHIALLVGFDERTGKATLFHTAYNSNREVPRSIDDFPRHPSFYLDGVRITDQTLGWDPETYSAFEDDKDLMPTSIVSL